MNHRTLVMFFISLLLAIPQARANEVARWNRVATEATAAAKVGPLVESRVLAIVHAAVHDALNAIDARYEPYHARMSAAPSASAAAAVAGSAHAVLAELLPQRKAAVDAELAATLRQVRDAAAAESGVQAGRQAARAILQARRDDGADRVVARPGGTRPGEYRPTPPDFTAAVFAQWGEIRPFVLTSAAQFRPAPPFDPKSASAREELEEVRAIGAQAAPARTAEQGEIARYWYEDSTQGWNRVAWEVALDRNLDAWESARLFALVNFAMADGFIGGFEAKYHYHYWRPATAIREAGHAAWLPYLWTPPVPDHPSTHTVLGAAAATALARFFGTDLVPFRMTSGEPYPGITRRFWSFSEAARENGASRVFAGIHFSHAVRAGYEQGEHIGHWVVERSLRPLRPAEQAVRGAPVAAR